MLRRIAAVATGVALALTLTTGPVLAEGPVTLYDAMIEANPVQYWVLDDSSGPASNFGSQQLPPVATAGSGPAVTWHTTAHPFGGYLPNSVRLNPDGVRSGQYLRSGTLPFDPKFGTIVIWFRVPKALPRWTQVLAVDNGAYSGTGGGLMISPSGQLVSEDAAGFIDFRSKRTFNDGRWHCAVWEDTYRPEPDPAGSTLYIDGNPNPASQSLVALWTPRLFTGNARLLLGDAGRGEVKGIGRFTGNLSNVGIYDYLLDSYTRQTIWDIGHGSTA